MNTLKELCIKAICEKMQEVTTLILFSPLPWTLIEEVIISYSKYKWLQILQESLDYDDFNLLDFEYEYEISPEIMKALIGIDCLEPFTHNDSYCVWEIYFKIHNYNLILCKYCFSYIRELLSE